MRNVYSGYHSWVRIRATHWSALSIGATFIVGGGAMIPGYVAMLGWVMLVFGVVIVIASLLSIRHDTDSSPRVTFEAVRTPTPQDRSNPAISVMIHNLTDVPAEKVTADILFPGMQYMAQIRCDSPVRKDHPVTANVYFSGKANTSHPPERTPADGLTTILLMARSSSIKMLGDDWARIRQCGPASAADRSIGFDVKYQDAEGKQYIRRHVLKYTLFHGDGVSISPL